MMTTETALSPMTHGGGVGKIKRPSLKSRGGTGSHYHHGTNGIRGYRAVRVTVPSTVVAELASKFNAVVVDTDQGDTARDIIKRVNKTLASGAAVRATVEKFESVEKKHNRMVVVRTNSERRRTAEQRRAAEQQRSLVKRRMEIFQKTDKPPKPDVILPKPNLRNLEKRHQPPKDVTLPVSEGPLLVKHKRLSIAKDPDAQLESVLNVIPQLMTSKPNSSFLHNRKWSIDSGVTTELQQTPSTLNAESNETSSSIISVITPLTSNENEKESQKIDEPTEKEEELPIPQIVNSFLHSYKNKLIASGKQNDYNYIGETQAIYEELCDMLVGKTEPRPSLPDVVLESSYYEMGDHHYTTIDGSEQNIYDDVITASNLNRSSGKTQQEDSYETVEAPPPQPSGQPFVLIPTATNHHSNVQQLLQQDKKELSDSSLEIDNSIYGLNPPSESTSSGVTSADSASGGRNSKFDLDEEWVDVDNNSDELQEIILFREKPKVNEKITSGWSIQVRKQLNKLYETKDKTNTINQEIPEEIYADYDSFESDDSWDDCKDTEKTKRIPYPCENRDLPEPPNQQNIYGLVPLVKKAGNRMKKRWSLGSLGLNRIRKLSISNMASVYPGAKIFDNLSDKSNEKKYGSSGTLISKTTNGVSSSIFYLNNTPVYSNVENNGQIQAPIRNTSKPPSSIDSRRLSVARPSSPPPPPPVKKHSLDDNNYSSLPRSIVNSKGRPSIQLDKSNTESTSENSSNQGSELYMRFADEPLYQFYAADLSQRSKSVFAGDLMEDCDGYEEISSVTSRPSALELITPCQTGHGQHRSLWCEVPEVKNSGILDTLTPRERKLQEAKFELITSEASYFKSLTVLEKHFVNSHSMNDETIVCKNDRKILFGNVNPVRKCSEKLLAALEKCWQDNILLRGLCEILYTHSKDNFDIFVKYCSNQIYIDRTLKKLREKNFKFNEALQRLETDPKCQSLSLHSFLMLPMQRITRLPLLVDAILSQMNPADNPTEYQMCELTLASLNAVVQNCNESTRKLERYEEMLLLSQQLEFSSKKDIKAMSVASSSRWLVRSGSMLHLTSPDAKMTFSRKLIRPTKLYFFLFNDMFFIAKRKSDENYTVIDYCARNFVQMTDATELVITSSCKNLLMLTILENHEGKTIEMLMSCDSESSKKRWIEAMSPPISSNPDETLYNEWDCPQVYAEHAYMAVQPDELSLQNGDIVKVLTKMNDGWYHGERIRDGEKGWFPGNYTSEIASQHARAKNLKQRYRLLAMSGSYLQSRQEKTKKK
ncbi:uncharacterized protein LOC126905152 isoform X2 [Daktulosphaira vitifoliae]|nr:uncharacterized protein LOC126905152 isoform X2 [Daktulosphaira vitifoliae]XP_050540572.1 uncharacterized protein LOC126905152 isoform X2 [Daktulosphaira vitifoliae]